jgi:hypothetical protein
MESEYSSYVEHDKRLHELIGPVLPGLRSLNAEQVDTLVFYLKSLHSYYPSTENHVANFERFSERLRAIRDSQEQVALQRKAAARLFKAMATCVAAGALLTVGAVIWSASRSWGAAFIAGAVGSFVLAEALFGKPALEIAKEQDRRYFLQCIRSARGCNELDWSGLFTYNGTTQPGPQSNAALEQTRLRVAELSSQLRTASYNDEYMQYSSHR